MIDNKLILKNSAYLYIRMLLILVVNLYTSRIVLMKLGISDYGIYNVVGGFVGMFALLSNSLSNSISRFFSVSLGRYSEDKISDVFSTSFAIQIVMAIFVLLLLEIFGVWFLNYKMVIPEERLFITNWVFQLSILSFIINLISVPYNALIVAYERMNFFAYISILEVLMKLFAVLFLSLINYDSLLIWSIELTIISLAVRCIYGKYCKLNFPCCKIKLKINKKLFKEVGSFAGWNFIGESAGILRNEGVTILLNLYFGPIVNAANGIAMQVNSIVAQFSNNFLTAINPQIIKGYASGEIEKTFRLVISTSRLTFFILFIIVIPIFVSTDYLLRLWLGKIPNYSVVFVQLVLVLTIIEALSLPIISLKKAIGNMKNYQLTIGLIHLLNFPISLLLLSFGMKPYFVFYIAIFLCLINTSIRLQMLKKDISFPVNVFFREVLVKVAFVAFVDIIILIGIYYIYSLDSFYTILVSFLVSMIIVWLFGLNNFEKNMIIKLLIRRKKAK